MVDLKRVQALIEGVAGDLLGDQVTTPDESHKDDGSIVTHLDAAIQGELERNLGRLYPDIAFIGEEMAHSRQVSVVRGLTRRFWVLDPLDGTTNFVAGFPCYGVSLALIEDGMPVLGVVHDPVRGETFAASRSQGASLNGVTLRPQKTRRLSQCVANVDYKRLTRSLAERLVRSPPYRSQRNIGSCVLEWCWLAAGRFQLYLHGGQRLWDYAAGSLILDEAGGFARSFEGKPMDGHTLGKRSVIAAGSPQMQRLWSAWIFRQGCLSANSKNCANHPER